MSLNLYNSLAFTPHKSSSCNMSVAINSTLAWAPKQLKTITPANITGRATSSKGDGTSSNTTNHNIRSPSETQLYANTTITCAASRRPPVTDLLNNLEQPIRYHHLRFQFRLIHMPLQIQPLSKIAFRISRAIIRSTDTPSAYTSVISPECMGPAPSHACISSSTNDAKSHF